MDMDWERFSSERPSRRDAAMFMELRDQEERSDRSEVRSRNDDAEIDIVASIRSALASDRKSILSAHVKVCARRVLGFEEDAVLLDNIPLQDVGLDSLMALEMRNELAQSLGLTLGAGLLFDYPAVDQVTQHLLGLLAKSLPADDGAVVRDTKDQSVAALNALSDEEAELLLIQELERAEGEKANA